MLGNKTVSCVFGKSFRVLTLFTVLVLFSLNLFSQTEIGGHDAPLQFSTHTYNIFMGSPGNDVLWNIYPAGVTRVEIDNGTATPYQKGLAYDVVSDYQSDDYAYIEIRFSGNLSPDSDYELVYREESDDNCWDFSFLPFRLYGRFNVDLDPDNTISSTDCPETAGVYLEPSGTNPPDFPSIKTTIAYPVQMIYPSSDPYYITSGEPMGTWSFYFKVEINGRSGGTDASIESITSPAGTVTPSGNSYGNMITVDNDNTDFTIDVTYNDVPGVTQDIVFELTQVEGTYGEIDPDFENKVEHTINAIPNASYILALD